MLNNDDATITTPVDSSASYIRRLESLIDAVKQLNMTYDLDRLLATILDLATKNLNATRGTIYLLDEMRNQLWSKVLNGSDLIEIRLPLGIGIAGTVACTGEIVNLADARTDKRFYDGYDQTSGIPTSSMLCMPMRNRSGKIIGVFQIMNKKEGLFDQEDCLFLEALSDHATLAVENAHLYQDRVVNERINRELQIAGDMQQRLLPKQIPDIAGYHISALTQPCTSIGGDFYDVIPLLSHTADNRYAVVMADVAGKGIPAALLVSTLHACLHVYLQNPISLIDLAARLNELVYENSPDDKFITFFVMLLDATAHTLTYVNAGHNPPYVLRRQSKILEELPASGIPLGMMPHASYEIRTITLHPGDMVILYTDGIIESTDRTKKQFGEERFKMLVQDCVDQTAESTKEDILREVQTFIGKEPVADDISLCVLKRTL